MNNQLTVGITYDLANDYKLNPDDPPDKFSEFDNKKIVGGIARAIGSLGYKVYDIGSFQKLVENIHEIKQKVDIVFNTSEGLNGRNREAQVPIFLEYHRIPYVGSDALSMSLTLDKVLTKKILVADNIPTPKFLVSEQWLTMDLLDEFNFPLIVKPRWEGSSKGITPKAKVKSLAELNIQIDYVVDKYGQPALIEEFIAGREFTVAIIGNGKSAQVLPILEINIRGNAVGDKLFLARYVYSNDVHYVCPAKVDDNLGKVIAGLALSTYNSVECRDFGRVDLRVDSNGGTYVLEINPLPALSPQDAFGILGQTLDKSYAQMLGWILKTGCKRYGLR